MICTDSKLSEKASTVANAIKDKAQKDSKELELKDTCHIQNWYRKDLYLSHFTA